MMSRCAGFCLIAAVMFWLGGCGGQSGHPIPLHDLESIDNGIDQAPACLKVFRVSGPATLSVGATWELKAEAGDPEGTDVTYRWIATSGKLSRTESQRTFFTATEPVGRAEITIEAQDAAGNLTRGSFGVVVPYDLPQGPVVDIRDSVGYYCSLAIDGADNPHIAFHNNTHPSLHYAYHDGNTCEIETIEGYGLDIGGAAGYNASMALDASGTPHIAYLVQYTDQSSMSLNYATKSGGTWSLVTVDQAGDRGHFNATLKINPATGKPEILYAGENDDEVKHAVCSGTCSLASSWNSTIVYTESRGHTTYSNRAYPGGFAIRANGTRLAVVSGRCYDTDYDPIADLFTMQSTGGTWSSHDTIITLRAAYSYSEDRDASRMVLDRDEEPLVLHEDGVYHRLSAGNWNLSEVESFDMDNTSNYARFDILCDQDRTPPASGMVWMASPHTGALELVNTNDRGYFEYTYIGSVSSSGMARASVAVDSAGAGHICWVDDGVLMYQ